MLNYKVIEDSDIFDDFEWEQKKVVIRRYPKLPEKMKKGGRTVFYVNYTNYIEDILKRYWPSHQLMERSGPLYKSGMIFEKSIKLWCEKVLDFQWEDKKGMPIFDLCCRDFTGYRIMKSSVKFFGRTNKIDRDAGYDVEDRNLCKTELCLYAKKINPTDIFPSEYYSDNGDLNIRVEVKTQNVPGTAFEKNTEKIESLYYGSPEKAIIFLITGKYIEPRHFRYARKTANKCNNGRSEFGNLGKKIVVMDERDFVRWSIKTYGVTKEQNYSNMKECA